ncbi:MAG: AAA family ATPase [Candidatus Methylacidiphilales bacterium]
MCDACKWIPAITQEMRKAVVGQQYLVERLLIGLLANGHVLLEGVPGLAKTTTVKALASCIHADFKRIQFTPDLLPSDVVGTLIYNPRENTYSTKKGPIFANLVLADEINRSPAKVQSALLEAMQEHQVTIGDETHLLPQPFLVLATQNPLEQEGTYALPEAQVDRFMLKVVVDYGTAEEEKQILELMASNAPKICLNRVVDVQTIMDMRVLVDRVYVDEQIKNYIVALVLATRNAKSVDPKLEGLVRYGVSPRATINLTLAAKAHAFMQGRAHVTPLDVRAIAMDVLRHRVLLTYEAEAEEVTSEKVVEWILDRVAVP